MADVTYKIIIEGSGGGGGGAGGDKPRSVAATPKGDELSPSDELYKTYETFKNCAPVAWALKYADMAITNSQNRVALKSGRATYQQQIQYKYSVAKQGIAVGGAIVAGIATGNPLMMVAAGMSIVDKYVGYANNAETIRLEKMVENISVGMANVRAGAGGNRNSN